MKSRGISHLRESILELIRDNGLRVGDKLPSEMEMTERFNVSRPTLREALKLLEMDAVIEARQGKGRFLSAGAALSIARPITKFESVSRLLESHKHVVETKVLGFGIVHADTDTSAALDVDVGTPLVRVERLRHAKREALVYSLDWIPQHLFSEGDPSQIDWKGSIVNMLAQLNLQPVASTAIATATMLPDAVVGLHGLTDFGPAFLIEETCFTVAGTRVIFARDYHRGSAFTFSFVRK
ncbi:MAG: GntR family transcriptional regulator [Planctomycetales bacterium]|nr:GntR family transcriptional regulator [Planctomycetales bacterium]